MFKRVLIVWALVAFFAVGALGLDLGGMKQPLKMITVAKHDVQWTTTLDNGNSADVYPAAVTLYCPAAITIAVRMRDAVTTEDESFDIPAATYFTVAGPVANIRILVATDTLTVFRWTKW